VALSGSVSSSHHVRFRHTTRTDKDTYMTNVSNQRNPAGRPEFDNDERRPSTIQPRRTRDELFGGWGPRLL